MKLVHSELMNELLELAAASPRRRSHRNFHPTLEDPIHRLLIGAMPDTEFPVHRHRNKWELFIVLKGEVEAIFFDDGGKVTERRILTPGGDCCAVEIPAGSWHTYRIKTPTVIMEVKPGPYQPITAEDTLPGVSF